MPTSGEPKPTESSIRDIEGYLSQIWTDAHDSWNDKVRYYNGTYDVWPSELRDLRPSFRPPVGAAKVDGAVDSLLASEPLINRVPETRQDKTKADVVETWLRGIFDTASSHEPISIWRQSKQNLMLLGTTVIEGPILLETAPPEDPARKPGATEDEWRQAKSRWDFERSNWMPIRLRVPSPTTVLLEPFSKRPEVAVKRAQWYAKDILAMMDKRRNRRYATSEVGIYKGTTNPYERIPCVEYWSRDWHAMMHPGGLLYVEENAWGFVPFSHCFTGWGQTYSSSQSGPTEEDRSVQVKALSRGILDGIMDTIKLYAQATSGVQQALMAMSYMKRGTTQDAADMAQQLAGDIVGGINRSDLWWMDTPNFPNWGFQAQEEYRRIIEEGTFSSVLVGVRPEGVSTVGSHALLRKDAGSRFNPVMEQLSSMATIVGENILRLVDGLGESMWANGERVGSNQIKGNYAVNVRFQSSDPVVRFQELEQARQDVLQGLMSRETYYAIKGQEDATGEDRRILEDTVMKSPEVQALLGMVVKQGLGLGDLEAAVQQAQGPQVLGPNGQPARPTSPPGEPPQTVPIPQGSPQEAESLEEGMRKLYRGGP